jgi:hypothetical protein
MTHGDRSGGGMTGATGDLTPDDIQRDFEPGEWREASDSTHQAGVTRSQASHHHEHDHVQPDEPGDEGQVSEVDEAHAREPRESRIGGDERADREHF